MSKCKLGNLHHCWDNNRITLARGEWVTQVVRQSDVGRGWTKVQEAVEAEILIQLTTRIPSYLVNPSSLAWNAFRIALSPRHIPWNHLTHECLPQIKTKSQIIMNSICFQFREFNQKSSDQVNVVSSPCQGNSDHYRGDFFPLSSAHTSHNFSFFRNSIFCARHVLGAVRFVFHFPDIMRKHKDTFQNDEKA